MKKELQDRSSTLKAYEDNQPIKDLEGDEVLLLPPPSGRLEVAYALREPRFVMLDIESLRDPPASDNVFQNLRSTSLTSSWSRH